MAKPIGGVQANSQWHVGVGNKVEPTGKAGMEQPPSTFISNTSVEPAGKQALSLSSPSRNNYLAGVVALPSSAKGKSVTQGTAVKRGAQNPTKTTKVNSQGKVSKPNAGKRKPIDAAKVGSQEKVSSSNVENQNPLDTVKVGDESETSRSKDNSQNNVPVAKDGTQGKVDLATVVASTAVGVGAKAGRAVIENEESIEQLAGLAGVSVDLVESSSGSAGAATDGLNQALMTTAQAASAVTALRGIGIAGQAITFLKTAGELGYRAIRDAGVYKERNTAQEHLKNYDLKTGVIEGDDKAGNKLGSLKESIKKRGSDRTRNKKQIAADRLINSYDLVKQGVGIGYTAAILGQFTGSATAGAAVPGFGVALTAMNAVRSAVETGSQINAMNNLAKAKKATNDPLLQAMAKHIKQERTIDARKSMAQSAAGFAATGAAIGVAASGVGAPIALAATGGVGAAIGGAGALFSYLHGRKLGKQRELAVKAMKSDASLKKNPTLNNDPALLSLAEKNIGVAEKAFLARLRGKPGEDRSEAVAFLQNFGITKNTIARLQHLEPQERAEKKLREVLYQDKVKYEGLQLRQTGRTILHIVGVTTLAKRIKTGSIRLKSRLKPSEKGLTEKDLGKSMTFSMPTERVGSSNNTVTSDKTNAKKGLWQSLYGFVSRG